MKKETTMFTKVRKRDGSIVEFDQHRITQAIFKALNATKEGGEKDAERVSDKVLKALKKEHSTDEVLGIETIQNYVERGLMMMDYYQTAKAYIQYRDDRAKVREKKKDVPEHVKKLVAASKKYFRNALGEFIYFRSYSRWIEAERRRETWIESIQRYMDFMKKKLDGKLTDPEYAEVQDYILNMKAMPSMRLLWSAGPAAESTNVSGYNCSYIAISELQDFAEIMYLSMCGTGVGFSVEYETTEKLPQIKKQELADRIKIVVEDSKEGWAIAFVECMKHWYDGRDVDVDFSKLRPMGARLHTMGGRSSGPGPLKALIEFARVRVLARQGRRLKPIDVHDIACKIGEIVEMGGVRRSAMLSLSNLDDGEMRSAKVGEFWILNGQRHMANNSAAYNSKPTSEEFLDEWKSLKDSRAGERGIFNRAGLKKQLPARRWKVFERDAATSGSNPCGEIVLKSKQFCNLTEVVCRAEDTLETLMAKIRIATILGTFQSTLTNFPFLSKEWKKNCEEERLLGVSLTGQWDCPAVRDAEVMRKLREYAIEVNKEYAKRFGINQSTAITCVKPSGTVSQLVDSASGLHLRHAKHYIRRIRISATDPLFEMLKEQKYPYVQDVGQTPGAVANYVLDFVVKAPEGSKTRNEMKVTEQLNYWKMLKENFTEHNPSATIYIDQDEWMSSGNWIYENWDMVGGLAFLPKDNGVYVLAPYEEIKDDKVKDEKTGEEKVVKTAEEKFKEMAEKLPEIDFSEIVLYEQDDETKGAKELACAGGVCEIN